MRHREANLTALAAIGPRKKRKILDSPSASAAAEVTSAGALRVNAARRRNVGGEKKTRESFNRASTVAGFTL